MGNALFKQVALVLSVLPAHLKVFSSRCALLKLEQRLQHILFSSVPGLSVCLFRLLAEIIMTAKFYIVFSLQFGQNYPFNCTNQTSVLAFLFIYLVQFQFRSQLGKNYKGYSSPPPLCVLLQHLCPDRPSCCQLGASALFPSQKQLQNCKPVSAFNIWVQRLTNSWRKDSV